MSKETYYSRRGVPHTIDIQYDRYQRAYGIYFDGKLLFHADNMAEAIDEKAWVIKQKQLLPSKPVKKVK